MRDRLSSGQVRPRAGALDAGAVGGPAPLDVGAVSSSARRGLVRSRGARWGIAVASVVAGVGILAASAWLSVPFYPVPMTMQTLAVLLVGGLLGPRAGAAAVATYLAAGLAGAPFFHNGTFGPAVLLGPTGGYLVGFLPAVALMGWFAQRSRRAGKIRELVLLAAGAFAAEAAIYAVGVPWLTSYVGSMGKAFQLGLAPFVLGDLLKVAVAIGALRLRTAVRGRNDLPLNKERANY